MKRTAVTVLVLVVSLAIATTSRAAGEPEKESKLQDRLLGTWKMVSARYGGKEFTFPAGVGMVKHITSSQFMWVTHDEEGKLIRAAGGSYTLKGNAYDETPTYGLGSDFDLIKGKSQSFTCKIDGKIWQQNGKLSNGLTIEEV